LREYVNIKIKCLWDKKIGEERHERLKRKREKGETNGFWKTDEEEKKYSIYLKNYFGK